MAIPPNMLQAGLSGDVILGDVGIEYRPAQATPSAS